MKTTSSGRRTQKEEDLQKKKTSKGRQPQNIKNHIPQQPLIGSSSNFELKLRVQNQNQKCLK